METLAKDLLVHYGPLAIGWLVAGYLLFVVFRDRKKGNDGLSDMVRRGEFDVYRDKIAQHLSVIEGRVADNYAEFKNFQVEVAKELATIEDLHETETRIKEHIDHALKRSR